ncbi:MAG: hypothetical protein IT285_08075 [Bdellovibrionales bacterium]|nr:hypothetical protein [Bdellovibrionales bacterium]
MRSCSRLIASALVVSVLGTVAVAAPIPVANWEELSKDDGIVTYSREIPGTDVVAFRGEGLIKAPIAKVANILIDTPRKLEWVAKIEKAKDIRSIGPYERIEYNHTRSGVFIVRDRDFVFHAKGEFNDAQKQMIFRLKSVKDERAPEAGPVRGELQESKYVLTSRKGGKETYVEVEILADPKGSIPKWLVNLFQKSWPRKTLENMRKQAKKKDVIEHPLVKAHFESLEAAAVPATTSDS